MNEDAVRVLAPQVLGIFVRRGNDFAAAEDAVQDALLEAHRSWGGAPPDDPKGWLLTVAGRKLIDARRSEAARRRREDALSREPEPGPAGQADDTLLLLFLCCHPALSPEGTYVRYGGPGVAPVTTDGPFPETKELAAGWFIVDVESEARAHEVAAYLSSAPGKDGQPLYEWIEVRPVMSDAPAAAE